MSPADESKRSPSDLFRAEAAAEEAQRKLAEEGKQGLTNRCAECGALGSLEEQEDGQVRCIDCDEVVGAARKMGGYGRK
jgi:hypothetical protein